MSGADLAPEYTTDDEAFRKENPMADFLRMDRMPHIWCPGCGIGTVVTSLRRGDQGGRLRHGQDRRGFGHRLHGPGRRLRQIRLLPHHAWPRHSLRHRPEARQSRAQGGGHQRRRRPDQHRRQSSHSRRAPQHGPHGHLREQFHLWHDRRTGDADDADHGQRLDDALRQLRNAVQPAVPGGCRRRDVRGSLDLASRPQHHEDLRRRR